uniref:Uncharacterized protein n=1 Tax=Clytia hemisphaerica TaxID=252671 RepID=A0A7M5X4H9_9CNID
MPSTKSKNKTKKTKKNSLSEGEASSLEDVRLEDDTQSSTIQKSLAETIKKIKDELSKEISDAKLDIISQLKNENESLKAEVKETKSRLIKLESENINLQQYIRRNNVEICGIPDDVEISNLESKVIDVAERIGVIIDKKDIEACHRLKKGKKDKCARSIVRFINRKKCDELHQNKKKLGSKVASEKLKKAGLKGKIFINCNLAPYSKFLWSTCQKLYEERLIDRFWVYNGTVFISINENNMDVHTKIEHLNTLEKIFPGYDFHTF